MGVIYYCWFSLVFVGFGIMKVKYVKEKKPYLKKKKLYELAKQHCSDIPKLRDCEYRFHRGSEWLKWNSSEESEDGWITWSLFRTGAHVSLEKVLHLEAEFKATTIERKVFYL